MYRAMIAHGRMESVHHLLDTHCSEDCVHMQMDVAALPLIAISGNRRP